MVRPVLLCCHRSWTVWAVSVEGELSDLDVGAEVNSGDIGSLVVVGVAPVSGICWVAAVWRLACLSLVLSFFFLWPHWRTKVSSPGCSLQCVNAAPPAGQQIKSNNGLGCWRAISHAPVPCPSLRFAVVSSLACQSSLQSLGVGVGV